MPADLEHLLNQSAPPADRGLDAEAIVRTGLRRRRRRTVVRGAGVLAAVLLLGVTGARVLSGARVDLAVPPAGPGWPLAVRYEVVAEERGSDPRRSVSEFAGNSWDDWVNVSLAEDGNAIVHRWGPQRRDGSGSVAVRESAPFDLVAAATRVELTAEEPLADDVRVAPHPEFNPWRFGSAPQPRADRTIVEGDLPELRRQVAERLSLNPDLLDSVRSEHDACAADCGLQRHTYVWLPSLHLPLYVEEIDPDGSRFEMEVTHLREGLTPPPNPLPAPPPAPPSEAPAGDDDGGLSYRGDGMEFEFGRGTRYLLAVTNRGPAPSPAPARFRLDRWDGLRWVPVADLPADQPRSAVDDLRPGSSRRVQVRLPDDVEPGWHRLVVADQGVPEATVQPFYYAGDPNR